MLVFGKCWLKGWSLRPNNLWNLKKNFVLVFVLFICWFDTHQIVVASCPVIKMFFSRQTEAIFSPSSVPEWRNVFNFAIDFAYSVASCDIISLRWSNGTPWIRLFVLCALSAESSKAIKKDSKRHSRFASQNTFIQISKVWKQCS